MTTTAVFAEMLVAGIEAMVWIVLITLAIAKPSKAAIGALVSLKDWAALITAIILAIAYGIGIVIDRASDSFFNKIKIMVESDSKTSNEAKPADKEHAEARKKERAEARNKEDAHVLLLRLRVLARSDKVTDFIEYIRSRIRVARSTAVNLGLTTIATEAFLLRCTHASPSKIAAFVLLLSGLTILAVFAAIRIRKAYDKWLTSAAEMPCDKYS
jgi:hypothetical protein